MRISGAGTAPVGRRGRPAALDLAPGRPVLGRASLRRGKEWRLARLQKKRASGSICIGLRALGKYMKRKRGGGFVFHESLWGLHA